MPGAVGGAAGRLLRVLLPAGARRGAALALGIGLGVAAPGPRSSQPAADRRHRRARRPSAVPDWPDDAGGPSPTGPRSSRPTPTSSSAATASGTSPPARLERSPDRRSPTRRSPEPSRPGGPPTPRSSGRTPTSSFPARSSARPSRDAPPGPRPPDPLPRSPMTVTHRPGGPARRATCPAAGPRPDAAAAARGPSAGRCGWCSPASRSRGRLTGRDRGRAPTGAAGVDADFGPAWSLRTDLPDPAAAGRRLIALTLEAFAGRRPLLQLQPLTSAGVFAALSAGRRPRWCARARRRCSSAGSTCASRSTGSRRSAPSPAGRAGARRRRTPRGHRRPLAVHRPADRLTAAGVSRPGPAPRPGRPAGPRPAPPGR